MCGGVAAPRSPLLTVPEGAAVPTQLRQLDGARSQPGREREMLAVKPRPSDCYTPLSGRPSGDFPLVSVPGDWTPPKCLV